MLINATIATPFTNIYNTTTYTLHVTDTNGCKSLVTDTVVVTITPKLQVNAGADTTIYANTKAILQASGAYTYIWLPSTFFANNTLPYQEVVLSQTQLFTLQGADSIGCISTKTKLVTIYKPLYVPTAFTPNNDGVNDVFMALGGNYYDDFKMNIYNRYGQLIFTSTNILKGWDGTYKQQLMPTGAYVFQVEYYDKILKQKITQKGTVMLII